MSHVVVAELFTFYTFGGTTYRFSDCGNHVATALKKVRLEYDVLDRLDEKMSTAKGKKRTELRDRWIHHMDQIPRLERERLRAVRRCLESALKSGRQIEIRDQNEFRTLTDDERRTLEVQLVELSGALVKIPRSSEARLLFRLFRRLRMQKPEGELVMQ
jgi:hypothetical protein